jgi:acyl-CoA thioester hydrolase
LAEIAPTLDTKVSSLPPEGAHFSRGGPSKNCPPATTMAKHPFSFPIRVYWEDTDAGGIVFYANYLKFFERARTEWLRSFGIEQQQLKDTTGGMFVVAETSLRYLRPARLDNELIVTAQLQKVGRAAITVHQQVLLKNTLLCEGSIRIGWVDANNLQPGRIPQNIVESLRV